jgi:hypothetical protein
VAATGNEPTQVEVRTKSGTIRRADLKERYRSQPDLFSDN